MVCKSKLWRDPVMASLGALLLIGFGGAWHGEPVSPVQARFTTLLNATPRDYSAKKKLVEEALALAEDLKASRKFKSAELLYLKNLSIWPNHPETLERLQQLRLSPSSESPVKHEAAVARRDHGKATGRTAQAIKRRGVVAGAGKKRHSVRRTAPTPPTEPAREPPAGEGGPRADLANRLGEPPGEEPNLESPGTKDSSVGKQSGSSLGPGQLTEQRMPGFLQWLETYQTQIVVAATAVMALLLLGELIRLVLAVVARLRGRQANASGTPPEGGGQQRGVRPPHAAVMEAMALSGEAAQGERHVAEEAATLRHIGAFLDRRTNRPAHSQNVARLAAFITRKMGFDEQYVEDLRLAATVMDLGLIDLPSGTFRSSDSLGAEEVSLVRQHPLRSIALLEGYGLSTRTLNAVRHHHERWNGSGYPTGLSGRDIPLEARILAVADAFAAMTEFRAYRTSYSRGAALKQLMNEADRSFDRGVVSALYGAAVEKVMALRHEAQGA